MEFKVEIDGDEIKVKPIIERKGQDVIIHLPSLPLIQKLKQENKHDKRNL